MIAADEIFDVFSDQSWLGNFLGCFRVFCEDDIMFAQAVARDLIRRSRSVHKIYLGRDPRVMKNVHVVAQPNGFFIGAGLFINSAEPDVCGFQ